MYRGRLEQDLAIWIGKGLIEKPQAEALLAEYDARESSFSVGRVLMMIAATLIAAALLLLVASNWDAISRLVRVALLLASIWLFHGAAGWLLATGRRGLAQAALVLGTASFGAALSLVGQMYHLSGDLASMLSVWFAFTVLTAIAFRSGAASFVCGFLAWAYFINLVSDTPFDWWSLQGVAVPGMAAVLIGLVYYTGAGRLRHLAYLLLLGWIVWSLAEAESTRAAGALAVLGGVGFLLCALPASPLFALSGRAGAAPAFYAFVGFLTGIGALHLQFDDAAGRLAIGIVTMAASVAAIVLAGRDNGAVRYLAYIAFALEVLYLAGETVGSILGTSGLFLVSGLVVALAAWIVITLEKRMAAAAPGVSK